MSKTREIVKRRENPYFTFWHHVNTKFNQNNKFDVVVMDDALHEAIAQAKDENNHED